MAFPVSLWAMHDRSIKKRFKYATVYRFVSVLIVSSNLLPRLLWLRFCGWLGYLAYQFSPKPRQRTIDHLTLAFGKEKSEKEIKTLARQVFVSLGKNAGDLLRSYKIGTLENLNRILDTVGLENYERAHARGKGVMFLTAHVGAFDLQITNMALRGLKPHIIGTALKDEKLNELLQNYRNGYGAISIERGKESVRLFRALKSGGSIAILIDQDTKVKSVFTNFFNRPAATPVGAAVLALKSDAAVVPTYVYMDKNHHQHMRILPQVQLIRTGNLENDIVANTQLFTDITEQIIREHPTQWVWMHERWKTQELSE